MEGRIQIGDHAIRREPVVRETFALGSRERKSEREREAAQLFYTAHYYKYQAPPQRLGAPRRSLGNSSGVRRTAVLLLRASALLAAARVAMSFSQSSTEGVISVQPSERKSSPTLRVETSQLKEQRERPEARHTSSIQYRDLQRGLQHRCSTSQS